MVTVVCVRVVTIMCEREVTVREANPDHFSCFLATLVALHFTLVSKSVSESVSES